MSSGEHTQTIAEGSVFSCGLPTFLASLFLGLLSHTVKALCCCRQDSSLRLSLQLCVFLARMDIVLKSHMRLLSQSFAQAAGKLAALPILLPWPLTTSRRNPEPLCHAVVRCREGEVHRVLSRGRRRVPCSLLTVSRCSALAPVPTPTQLPHFTLPKSSARYDLPSLGNATFLSPKSLLILCYTTSRKHLTLWVISYLLECSSLGLLCHLTLSSCLSDSPPQLPLWNLPFLHLAPWWLELPVQFTPHLIPPTAHPLMNPNPDLFPECWIKSFISLDVPQVPISEHKPVP
jgi:hypothetical protein